MVQDRAILTMADRRPIVSRIMIYRAVPYSATLIDPYSRFQGHSII